MVEDMIPKPNNTDLGAKSVETENENVLQYPVQYPNVADAVIRFRLPFEAQNLVILLFLRNMNALKWHCNGTKNLVRT